MCRKVGSEKTGCAVHATFSNWPQFPPLSVNVTPSEGALHVLNTLLHQRGQNGPFSCGAVRPHLSHHSITQHPTIANPTAYQTAGLSHLHGGGSLCQTEPCCRCCTKLECQTARHDSDKCPSCLPGPFRSLDSGEAVGTGLNGESNQGLFYGIHMPLLTPGTIVSGSGNGASCRSQHFRSRTFLVGPRKGHTASSGTRQPGCEGRL